MGGSRYLLAIVVLAAGCSASRMPRAPALEDSEAKPAGDEPPAAGSGGGPGAGSSAGSVAEPLDLLPEFPWPPLAASETMDLTTMLQVRGQFGRLGDANVILQNALRRTGYDTVSYLAVPHGFALVTRIEQIDNTGEPKPGASRWSLEVQPLGFRKFSLSAYLHAQFYADPGRYRVLAFVVTDSPVPRIGRVAAVRRSVAPTSAIEDGSFLEKVSAKDTVAATLNDRRPVLGRHEMREASWNDHEAAGRICLQPGRVESFSRAQVPGPLDDRHHFVVRMRMRQDALASRDLDSVDPSPTFARIADQLCSLSPILVIGRREPLHLLGSQPNNLSLGLVGLVG
jgi:hypothetical protein